MPYEAPQAETFLCPTTGRRKPITEDRSEAGKAYLINMTAAALAHTDGLTEDQAGEAAQAQYDASIARMSRPAMASLPRQEDGTFVDMIGED